MSIMVVISLFGIMLLAMLTRVFLPLGQKPQGTVVKRVSLPFRLRLLYHRTSIYLIGTAMVLGGVGGWLSFSNQVIVVMATFAIIGIRINYTFTTEGLALNNVIFRPWSEFQEVGNSGRFLLLKSQDRLRPFKILLPPDETAEVERLLRKMVSNQPVNGETIPVQKSSKVQPVARPVGARPPKKRKALS